MGPGQQKRVWRLEEGAPCYGDDGCGSGVYCAGYSSDAAGVCQARGQAGASCERVINNTDCEEAFYCRRSSDGGAATCEARLAVGEPCDLNLDTCQDGLFCDQGTSTCSAPKPNGESCAVPRGDDDTQGESAHCESGACLEVDLREFRCVEPREKYCEQTVWSR